MPFWANDRREAASREAVCHLVDAVRAPDHPGQSRRYVARRLRNTLIRGEHLAPSGARDRPDKAVASPGHGRDVPGACLAVAERPSDDRHLCPEIAFLNSQVGPCAVDQFVLCDDVSGAFNQRDQNVECAPSNRYRLVVIEQKLL